MAGEWDDFEKAPAESGEGFDDFAEAPPVPAAAPAQAEPAADPDARLAQILAVTDDPAATDDEQVYRLQKITRQPSETIREWLPGTRSRFLSVGGSAKEFRRKYPVKAAVMENDPQAAGMVRVDEDINLLERLGSYWEAAIRAEEGLGTPAGAAALLETTQRAEAIVSPGTAPADMVRRTVEKKDTGSGKLTGVERLLGKGWTFNPAALLTEKGAEGYGIDPEKTKQPLVAPEVPGVAQASLEYEVKSLGAAQVMNTAAAIAAAEGDSPAYRAALVKAQDARNAVGLPPDLRLGPIESVINTASPLLASQYQSIVGSTLGRGAAKAVIKGAELVPGVVGRVARNKIVQKGAEIVAGELGGAVLMYPTERGMEFEQFLDLKTADGKPIDVQVAGRASAVGAAVVSLLDAEGSRQVVLASGPWGRKLAGLNKETQRGFIRALLTNKETAESFGKFLLATSKPVLQGAGVEGGIEGLQDIVADLSGFFTKVFSGQEGEALFGRLAAEAAQARPIESIASAAQTAVSTAVGVGVIAAPGHALTLAHAVTARQQALRRGADVATLAGVATSSKTAHVAPKPVAKAIERLMQQKGATAPDAAYVPVEEAERFFQAGGVADADIPGAIRETLGDAAAASYHEATEGLNGGKIRIPMADYLSRAGPTGFAEAMVQDTALSPSDKTVKQARKEQAEIHEGAKKLADEYEKTDVPHASEAESIMVGAVESWLDSQKMLDEDGRRRVVSLWRAMARTTAERFGLPEDVLFDTFTVEAMTKAGDLANPAKVMQQAAASRAIITTWRAKTPEERVRAFYEDRITGTLNPRGLDALIKETKPPLMVVWDIAGGKAINDDRKTGGHEVLDQVFRGVAQTVHAAAPGRTGKQGGSIVALVGSQPEADQLVKDVLAAHPEKRVKLRAWVGPVAGTAKQTVKAIGKASKQKKDEQEAAGVWPKRGEAPAEWGGAVPAELAKGAARITGTDITPAMRAAYEGLSDFQRASAIYVDQFSEILTNDGWETIREKGTKAVTASVDVDGLKALNKALGEDGADRVLQAFGLLISRFGGADFDAAWLHGDEYAGQHNEDKPLRDFWDLVRQKAADFYLEIDVGEGRIAIVDGVRFSYGTGPTYADADRALQDDKQRRTEAGERGAEVDARAVRVVSAGELQGARDEVRRRRALEGRRVAEVADGRRVEAAPGPRVPSVPVVRRRGQSLSELAWRPADVLQKDTAAVIAGVLEQSGARSRVTNEQATGIVSRLRAAHPGVEFDLMPGAGGVLVLRRIIVPKEKRETGIGTRFMEALVSEADHAGVTVAATPSKDFGGTKSRIVAWNKRFGFVENKGRAKDYEISETMYRPPRAVVDRAVTLTPEFKEWFGRSKVVDAAGRPLVVYHGTASGGFDVFDPKRQDKVALMGPGFYFTEAPDIASEYVEKGANGAAPAPAVYPVFLRLLRPFKVDGTAEEILPLLKQFRAKEPPAKLKRIIDAALRADGSIYSPEGFGAWADNTQWAYESFDKEGTTGEGAAAPFFDYFIEHAVRRIEEDLRAGHLPKGKGFGEEVIRFIERNVFEKMQEGGGNIQDVLQRLGFDGITHIGGANLGKKPHRVWIAFKSEQVKSATGNRGTFDPTNPSILKQDGTEGARGWVEILRGAVNRTIRIVLTPDANLSTILHESGHAYMEVLSSLSERADAPAQLKADWETAKAWMGVKPGEVVSREHAEKWARGFEAYLMEGKAPSAALARVFTRFRSWLLQVYAEIRNLNAPLDDEIRGVFDRLLATDEEIATMRQRYEAQGPIFKTPEEAGMEASVYQAWLDQQEEAWSARRIAFQKRILKEQDKEARAAIRETRKRLKGEVEAAWTVRPDVQAWDFIRKGKVPEGASGLAQMLLDAQGRVQPKAAQLTPEQVKRVTEIEESIRRLTAERGLEERAQEILAEPGKSITLDEARERARAEAAEKAQDPLALSSLLRTVPVVVARPEGVGSAAEVVGAWEGEALDQGSEIRALSLPSWLTLEDFSAEPAVWEATWAALHGRKKEARGKSGRVVSTKGIARTGQSAPEAVQRLVADHFRRGMEAFPADRGEMLRGYVLGKLLSGGMRGELATKFKDQIGAWLATAPAARKYDSPLSPKQIDVLTKHASEGFKKWEADSRVQRPWLGQPLTPEAAQALPVAEVDESAQGAIDGQIATLRAEADQIAAQARGEAAKGVRVGLDYGAVVGIVGPEEAARAFRGAMLTEGGVAPDDLAQALGQPSGEALVREMATTPAEAAWVKAETERRLSAEHPSLLEDAKARREAMAGFVHSVGDSKAFEDELRAVRAKAGEEGAPIDYIKRAARVIVARKAVGEVRPDRALQDELTAANEALRAAAKGNWKQVAVQKQRQLLAHFVWREMEAARKQAEALETLGKRLQKAPARARLAKGGPAFLDGVDAILDALGVQALPDVGRYPRGGLEGAVAAIERSGGSVMFDPDTVQQALNQARRDPAALTVEQQAAILDALKNIAKTGGEVSRAILGNKRVDKEELVGRLVAESQANLPRGKAPTEDAAKTWFQWLGSVVSGFDGALLRPARVLGWLGGADADGVANIHSAWYQAFVLPMQRAKVEEARILREAVRPIMDAWEKMPKAVRDRMQDSVDGAALFPNHTPNLQPPRKRFELLLMALNAGNDSNLQRLLEGRGITPEQLQQALDLLTREEMTWVQSVLDAAESLWPMAQALEQRVAGVAPPKIEARPIVTTAGTFRGGYFPAVYAKGAGGFGNVGEVQAAADVAGFFDAMFARPGTQHSHLKGRAKEFAAPISFDPKVIQAHFAQVAHDLAFREAILSTAGLILDPRVQVELNRAIGPERAGQLRTWLEDVGRGKGAQPDKHAGPIDRFLSASKGRMAVMTMGYAADIAAGDLSNVLVAAVELDKSHWAAGLSEYTAHPFKAREFALKMSGELRFRKDRIVEDFRQQVDALAGKKTNPIIKHAWAFMEATDAATVTPFWLGAFRQAAAKGMSEADAVIWADAMVNKNFPSHSVVDMAPILRGKGAASALLFLHGFANTTYGVTRDQLHRVYVALTGDEVGGERIKKVATVSAKVTGHLLGYWIAYGVVGEFLSGRGPTDDDKDGELSADEWVSWFWRKLVLAPVYSIPLVGATIEGLVMGKPVSARSAPGLSLVERMVRQGVKVTKEGSGASDWIALGSAAAGALGYPSARPARAVDYVRKVIAGEAEPAGPLDFLGSVVYGDREGQGLNPPEAASRALEE